MLKKAFFTAFLGTALTVSVRSQAFVAPETNNDNQPAKITDISGLQQAENPFTPNHVKLDNNLDLEPARQALILALEQAKQNKRPDQKILIILGENHAQAQQHILEAMLLETLAEQGEKFTVTMELPDEFNDRSLEANIRKRKKFSNFSAVSHERVLQSCVAHKIPTAFIDSRFREKLDKHDKGKVLGYYSKDKLAQNIAQEHFDVDISKPSKAAGQKSVAIRNQVMISRLPAQSEINIHIGGMYHNAGAMDDPYEQSLMGLLKNNDEYYVVPVFLNKIGEVPISEQAFKDYPQSVMFENLDQSFRYYKYKPLHFKENKKRLGQQEAYIDETLFNNYSGPAAFFPTYE